MIEQASEAAGLKIKTHAPPISATVNQVQLTGDGWGFGWTAGVTLTPTPWTQIGVGYRSAIDQASAEASPRTEWAPHLLQRGQPVRQSSYLTAQVLGCASV
jgi:long-subunit fatty acid transport protein